MFNQLIISRPVYCEAVQSLCVSLCSNVYVLSYGKSMSYVSLKLGHSECKARLSLMFSLTTEMWMLWSCPWWNSSKELPNWWAMYPAYNNNTISHTRMLWDQATLLLWLSCMPSIEWWWYMLNEEYIENTQSVIVIIYKHIEIYINIYKP